VVGFRVGVPVGGASFSVRFDAGLHLGIEVQARRVGCRNVEDAFFLGDEGFGKVTFTAPCPA